MSEPDMRGLFIDTHHSCDTVSSDLTEICIIQLEKAQERGRKKILKVNGEQQTFGDLTVVCFLSTGAGLIGAGSSSLVPSLSILPSSKSADSDFLGTERISKKWHNYKLNIFLHWTFKWTVRLVTSLFAAVSDQFPRDPFPARLRAQQLQFGHNRQVLTDGRPELIKQETQPLDHWGAHLLIRAALLLVRL